jgi:predicted lipase
VISYVDLFTASLPNRKRFNDDTTNKGIEGYTGYDPGEKIFYIVFEPSNSEEDWKINLDFVKVPTCEFFPVRGSKVHRGFYKSYLRARHSEIFDSFEGQSEVKKIVVSGYSYGAAIACFYAFDFAINFPHTKLNMPQLNLVLFECPRIGNTTFTRYFNRRLPYTTNIINGQDIVTKLPFWWLGFLQIFTFGQIFMFSRRIGYNIMNIGKRPLWKLFSFKDHQYGEVLKSLKKLYRDNGKG